MTILGSVDSVYKLLRLSRRDNLEACLTFNVEESSIFICDSLLQKNVSLGKTKKIACALSEDSDQPGHPPSLTRFFTVRMKKAWVLRYPLSAQRRLRLI